MTNPAKFSPATIPVFSAVIASLRCLVQSLALATETADRVGIVDSIVRRVADLADVDGGSLRGSALGHDADPVGIRWVAFGTSSADAWTRGADRLTACAGDYETAPGVARVLDAALETCHAMAEALRAEDVAATAEAEARHHAALADADLARSAEDAFYAAQDVLDDSVFSARLGGMVTL